MTKQKWIVISIVVPIILVLVGLGFAAMSTNTSFKVPTWVPVLFFIVAGLLTMALVSHLIWGIVRRIRFQFPIVMIKQQGKTDAVSLNTTIKRSPPKRLEHDSVLWEDGGNNSWGNVNVIGPLCLKDYTPLSTKRGDKIEANLRYDTLISSSEYHFQLVCLECHKEYILSNKPKQIQESHDEVAIRFIGMRKREREKQER
jgi:hypothetical protein